MTLPPRSSRPVLGGITAVTGLTVMVAVGSLLSWAARTPMHTALVAEAQPAQAWRWDGAGLTRLETSGRAPASDKLDAAYDAGAGRIVVWAHGCRRVVLGFTGGCTDATTGAWALDAAGAWAPVAAAPGGLTAGAAAGADLAALDTRRGVVVAIPRAALPDEVAGAVAVYDAARDAVVVIASPLRST